MRKPWQGTRKRSSRPWARKRQAALRRDNYLCQRCAQQGRTTAATEVDHIVPLARGGADDLDNLQSLCRDCHSAKTDEDMGRRTKRQVGVDGWPVGA